MKRRTTVGLAHWLTGLLVALLVCAAPAAEAADVSLAWDPVVDPSLLGYKFYYGTAAGVYDGTFANEGASPFALRLCSFEDINAPTFAATGFDTGSYVCFALTAFNDGGESTYSNEVCVTIVYQTSVSAIPGGPGALRVSWSAPAADDSGTIDHTLIHYDVVSRATGEVYAGTGADQGNSPVLVTPGALNDAQHPSFLLTGLDDTQTYFVRVGVHTAAGACDPDAWAGCRNSDQTSGRAGACSNAADCDDGLFCNGAEACQAGACQPGTAPCTADATFCTTTCDEKADACNVIRPGDCVIGGACHRRCDSHPTNACETCAPDLLNNDWSACDSLSHDCRSGVCQADNTCTTTDINEGGACQTADLCASRTCVQGFCSGTPKDCTSLDSTCNVGQCNSSTGNCAAVPRAQSEACDDNDVCTLGDVCLSGTCQGRPMDCSQLNSGCDVGVCNGGVCETQAGSEGSTCNDNDPCTTGDLCTAGTCTGTALNCASLDSVCGAGVCDPSTSSCHSQAANEGGTCDDGDPCTRNDSCRSGSCVGALVDCTNLDAPCSRGVCNNGTCEAQTLPDDEVCGTGLGCIVSLCQGGACNASDRGCTALDDDCVLGVCDNLSDTCVTQPANEGGACDDGDPCTQGEACSSGTCLGGTQVCGEDNNPGDTSTTEDTATADVAEGVLSQDIVIDGGCGCSVSEGASGSWGLGVLLGLLVLSLRRRRG